MEKKMFGKKQTQDPDQQVFAIFDTKVNAYKDPIFAVNKFDLYRQIEHVFKTQPDAQLVTNSEDFQVFHLGDYYRKTGELITQQPTHCFNLHEIRSSLLAKNGPGALSPT